MSAQKKQWQPILDVPVAHASEQTQNERNSEVKRFRMKAVYRNAKPARMKVLSFAVVAA